MTTSLAPAPHGDDALARLVELLRGRRFAVLTGAGCSTESGIPDYRGPETRRRARNPIQYRGFVEDEAARRRYWSRSVVGWPRVRQARPNPAHRALARLEAAGLVTGVITQNVDRLHHDAGSQHIVELHGALADVRCLWCQEVEARDALQGRLLELNPRAVELRATELAPDGDAELTRHPEAETFEIAACRLCGGVLKPDVVFFGESVRREVVDAAFDVLRRAEALLVVGSSLAVFSGYRFILKAVEQDKPIGLINLGPPMRGADACAVHVDAGAGEALTALAEALI